MMVSYKNDESKSLLVSLFTHIVLIAGYFIFLHQQSLTLMQSSKMVVMEISNIERVAPKPVLPPPPEPVEEVKKVEPIKPIEKIKPVPKPIVKKEVLNPEPIREEVVQPPVEAVKPVVVPQEVAPIAPVVKSAEPYERTDFEIIRDKVLSQLIYPSIARRMNWNGVVQVALVIDINGHLISAAIHQSSGREILDNAALDAANKLKGQQLPKPQSTSTVILPIAFKLR